MHIEIGGEAIDRVRQHVLVIAAADIRHSLGNRHHGTDRRSAARPAHQLDVGLAEFPQRGGNVAFGIEIERNLALLEHLLFDDGFEQPALVGEINVERSLGDPGRAGDFAHAGAVKAQVQEHLAGAVENLTAF